MKKLLCSATLLCCITTVCFASAPLPGKKSTHQIGFYKGKSLSTLPAGSFNIAPLGKGSIVYIDVGKGSWVRKSHVENPDSKYDAELKKGNLSSSLINFFSHAKFKGKRYKCIANPKTTSRGEGKAHIKLICNET